MALIEIDGLPNLKMVDLSMATSEAMDFTSVTLKGGSWHGSLAKRPRLSLWLAGQ
jgi:hypothetical protein